MGCDTSCKDKSAIGGIRHLGNKECYVSTTFSGWFFESSQFLR